MERETRFELATFALARQRSTTEPLPQIYGILIMGISVAATLTQSFRSLTIAKICQRAYLYTLFATEPLPHTHNRYF